MKYNHRLALAVMAALGATSAGAVPVVPFQAPQRSTIGSGLGQTALPKGGVFQPRVEAAVQYAANINLAEDGEPQIDMAGLELAPGFYASLSNGTFTGAIDYSLVGRSWEDSDFNDVSHRLSANSQWLAVPEWFAIRADASYSDGVIDPRSGLNYGGLGIFGVGNLEEVATASVNPVLQHRFGDFDFMADYRYGRVWYLDQGKGQDVTSVVESRDSTDQAANLSVGNGAAGLRQWGTLFYNWQKSEYDSSFLPYEFERAGLDAGAQLSRTIALVGDVGVETDLEKRVADGGLDSSFWSVGLRWSPNDRTEAEARYGDRSFGETYFFSARHRARLLEFTASYSEQPTVETRRLSLGDVFPGELPPGTPDVDLGIFNSLPFISKDARAGVVSQGSRTTVGASAFWYERDYLATERSDENGWGGGFNASRQLASNLSADFDVSYREYERNSAVASLPPSDERDTQLLLRLNRTSGDKLTLSAETGYLTRSGDQDYDGWWVAMRARWTP